MTISTNAYSTYDSNNQREDFADLISNISPIDTPFYSMIAKGKAEGTTHEWQVDSLAAVDGNNAQLEGDVETMAAASATTKKSNVCQISKKTVNVTGTQQAVNKAGVADELDYQLIKRGKELKRDIEAILLSNQARVTGNSSTARKLGGIEAWFETNVSRGTSGANGGSGTSAATDGTQRAFTETLLKDVIQSCWDEGGEPDCVMVGSHNKQTFSTFTGGATKFEKAEQKTLHAVVDVYVSDFGSLEIIPNRFQRSRSALVLQKDMFELKSLRPIQTEERAKDSDSEKRVILSEYTLCVKNEKSSGIIADLTTS